MVDGWAVRDKTETLRRLARVDVYALHVWIKENASSASAREHGDFGKRRRCDLLGLGFADDLMGL